MNQGCSPLNRGSLEITRTVPLRIAHKHLKFKTQIKFAMLFFLRFLLLQLFYGFGLS